MLRQPWRNPFVGALAPSSPCEAPRTRRSTHLEGGRLNHKWKLSKRIVSIMTLRATFFGFGQARATEPSNARATRSVPLVLITDRPAGWLPPRRLPSGGTLPDRRVVFVHLEDRGHQRLARRYGSRSRPARQARARTGALFACRGGRNARPSPGYRGVRGATRICTPTDRPPDTAARHRFGAPRGRCGRVIDRRNWAPYTAPPDAVPGQGGPLGRTSTEDCKQLSASAGAVPVALQMALV